MDADVEDDSSNADATITSKNNHKNNDSNDTAPWYAVPQARMVAVEHPCIVKNAERAIQMIGGPSEVAQILAPGFERPLGLRFVPDDPASRPVVSYCRNTNDVLLRVTVPRRTGRKRKRGSSEPFVMNSNPRRDHSSMDAGALVRSLKDNPQQSQVEVEGTIRSTHVWRSMPDFGYSRKESTFLNEIHTKILSQQYPLVKQWSLPRTYGLADPEVFPPPVLSTQGLPLNYTYRQNPAIKVVTDHATGKKTLQNLQAHSRLYTRHVQFDDEPWPAEPDPRLPPLSQLPEGHQTLYQTMRDLFDRRPLWTRRAFLNHIPDDVPFLLARSLVAYVAFPIRSGPWRDTFCRFGVDPRKDAACRKYQSILIQLVSRDRERRETFGRSWVRSKDKTSHIFTGTQRVPVDGKSWQLCDLHDPHLQGLVEVPDLYIRPECEVRYFGWYGNGTMAKMRILLKAKVDAIIARQPLDDAAFERFLKLPECWDVSGDQSGDAVNAYLPQAASKRELEWASAYRSLCRTMDGNLPPAGGSGKGRLSRSKPTSRPSFIDPDRQSPLGTTEQDILHDYEEPEDDDGDEDDDDDFSASASARVDDQTG